MLGGHRNTHWRSKELENHFPDPSNGLLMHTHVQYTHINTHALIKERERDRDKDREKESEGERERETERDRVRKR